MATRTHLTAEQVGRRGEAIYQAHLRAHVEPGNTGRYLSLDIDSGEYEIGNDRLETLDRLSARLPNAEIYTVLIGYPAAGAIGTGLRPIKDTL